MSLDSSQRAEREALDGAIDRAADAVTHARQHGVEAAMNILQSRGLRLNNLLTKINPTIHKKNL